MKQDHLIKELKNAWQIALLKKPVMHHVGDDKHKIKFAYGILVAAALLAAIGQLIFGVSLPFLGTFKPSIGAALGGAISQVISTVIGIYVISFIATSIFKGSAKHAQFFRVMAYSTIVMWIALIPSLSFIGAIWGLVLIFVILKTVHKLTTGGVIGTLIVGIIAMTIISFILSPLYAAIGINSLKFSGSDSFNFDQKDFEMNIKDSEGGTVNINEGKMKITTPDGEVIEIEIPSIER